MHRWSVKRVKMSIVEATHFCLLQGIRSWLTLCRAFILTSNDLKSQSNFCLLFIASRAEHQPQDFRESGQQSSEVELHVAFKFYIHQSAHTDLVWAVFFSFLLQIGGELQQLIGVSGSVGQAAERPGSAALTGPPGLWWAGPAGLWDPVLTGGPIRHRQDRLIHAFVAHMGRKRKRNSTLSVSCTVHILITEIFVDRWTKHILCVRTDFSA